MDIRKARPVDAADCARLVLVSAEHFLPAVFGPGIGAALRRMAEGQGTLFSHAHAWIAEDAGQIAGSTRCGIAGMLLGYTGREKAAEDLRTGLALFRILKLELLKRLGALLRLQVLIGRIGIDEYYISNVAVYPDRRGGGIGAALIRHAVRQAGRSGAVWAVLDVETDNERAIRLYERLGFTRTGQTLPLVLDGRVFSFYRMAKKLPIPAFPACGRAGRCRKNPGGASSARPESSPRSSPPQPAP